VVLSSTSSAVPSDKVTLYVTSPHEVWLNVSHDIASEVSLLSNTLITGRVGGPVRTIMYTYTFLNFKNTKAYD